MESLTIIAIVACVIAYIYQKSQDKRKMREADRERAKQIEKENRRRKYPITVFKEEILAESVDSGCELQFQKLCDEFHVPKENARPIILESVVGLHIQQHYIPSLIWKSGDDVNALLILQEPFLYKKPVDDFTWIGDSISSIASHAYASLVDTWSTLNPFIKKKFVSYIGGEANTTNAFNRCFTMSGFIFTLDSLQNILDVIGKPSSEYKILINKYRYGYRDILKPYFPDQIYNTQNVKQSIDKMIQDRATYTEIQTFVNSKVEDETIKKSQMAEYLNYAREKTENTDT